MTEDYLDGQADEMVDRVAEALHACDALPHEAYARETLRRVLRDTLRRWVSEHDQRLVESFNAAMRRQARARDRTLPGDPEEGLTLPDPAARDAREAAELKRDLEGL